MAENRHDATDLCDYFRREDEAWDARAKPSGAAIGFLLCALSGALVGVLVGAAGMWWWWS